MTAQIAHWLGTAGDDYTERNALAADNLLARIRLWRKILTAMDVPGHALEIGANVGQNLLALRAIYREEKRWIEASAVEPNERARGLLRHNIGAPANMATNVRDGIAEAITFPDAHADLVFTSGVLIHIHPDRLLQACSEIVRCSSRYIVAIEYFSKEPRMVPYRGEPDRLWTCDFGGFYLDNFKDLAPVACGFAWQRTTGLDDLTWWVLEKR